MQPPKIKGIKKLAKTEIVPFTRQLASMAGAGMPILSTLQTLEEQCANVDRYYDAIFIGDSITHFWDHKGNDEVFAAKFKGYRIFNAGFGGDRTQNVLWNILHGGLSTACIRVSSPS